MGVTVTGHAIMRYQERIENVPEEVARKALSSPIVQLAAIMGAPYVRLGTGQRIVIEDGHVVTGLPADKKAPRYMDRRARNGETGT